MGRNSKVASSNLRPEIDKLLLQGRSYNFIEKWCGEQGETISHTSIRRYAKDHLTESEDVKKDVKEDGESSSSETIQDMLSNPLVIPILEVQDTKELNKIIAKGLKNSIAGMVVIVEYKISKYASGEIRSPKEDVILLEKLISMSNQITGKKGHTRSGKNIFDIDEALKDSEVSPVSNKSLEELLKESENLIAEISETGSSKRV